MRLKMKGFDWKKLLLEKGERVALYACLGIMALMLILSLFMPGRGLFSGSPSANEEKLRKQNEKADQKLREAAPTEAERQQLAHISDELKRSGEHEKVDPAQHRGNRPLFVSTSGEDIKRRAPKLIEPTEYRAASVFVQMPVYMYEQDGKMIRVLRGAKGGDTLSRPPTVEQTARNFKGLQKQLGGDQGIAREASQLGSRLPSRGGDRPEIGPPQKTDDFNPLKGGPGQEGKSELVAIADLQKVDTLKDARLAENILPLRMVIVVGSFPLREQVMAFQRALRLRTPEQVFAARIDGKGPQFQFLGLNIERRTIGADGKPGAWGPLNVDAMYKPLAVGSGRRFAEEKPDLKELVYDGLVLPRPLQVREDAYPDIERELKGIKDTLAELAKKGKENQPAPRPDKRFVYEGFNPFAPAGADEPPEKPEEPKAPALPGTGGELDNRPQWQPDEYCLLRFLDTTVEPGKTYEYRYYLRMANPNFKHPNAVSGTEASEKELVSKEPFLVKDEKGEPLQVKVPPEAHFYAAEPPPNADKKQAYVQFHRWLEAVSPNPNSSTTSFAVGDWVVADRVAVNRGEYLPRTYRAEVPVWVHNPGAFTLASNPAANPAERHRIPLPPHPGSADTILVDFQGGPVSHSKVIGRQEDKPLTATITDKAPAELLYLSPDGKLLARDSETDKQDAERDQRQKQYKKVIDEIKKKKEEKEKEKKPMPPGGIGAIGG